MTAQLLLPDSIYLNGPFCSGKGHIAALLVELGYEELSWSDAVYERVAEQYAVSVEYIRRNKGTYRSALQNVGMTERITDPNYWIDIRQARAAEFEKTVEAGTRFKNEAEAAIASGGVVIKVLTSTAVRRQRYLAAWGVMPTAEQENHPSEKCDIPYNFVISGELRTEDILPRLSALYSSWLWSGKPVFGR